MSYISEEVAKRHLEAWLEADLAVSTGQSYKIGSRNLTRADASEISRKIKYWQSVLSKIDANKKGKSSKRRIIGVVPRDI
ncbi:MAG: hypothetical protein FH761_17830 [Firmicutes bacterium]|nr:hypothetical protein [Bacillota bacterium]